MATGYRVIFTAHSVPQRTITEGDPYEAQTKETASLVASAVGLASDDWKFAFQSQGMSGGAWLGTHGRRYDSGAERKRSSRRIRAAHRVSL